MSISLQLVKKEPSIEMKQARRASLPNEYLPSHVYRQKTTSHNLDWLHSENPQRIPTRNSENQERFSLLPSDQLKMMADLHKRIVIRADLSMKKQVNHFRNKSI